MVEQIGRQLDLLKDNDSEAAAAVIKVLRQQVDSFEKESQQRHHHHHQQPSTQQQQQQQQQQKSNHHATESKTEDKGVQADWVLLQETEAELMIIRPPQRLSVPDLTKPRQRIGSKSHSVDDDDADEDGVAKQASSVSAAEAEEELRLVNDRLVSARLREANLLAHLKDYRHRADDLRRLISLRDSQIERLEDEIARLKDALVEGRGKEKELQSFISDLQLTLDDLHSKYDEYVVLGQLRDSEHQQVVEGLEQEVAKLKEEKLALSYGQPALGYQSLQHLSKNAVHFQSTGSLVPTSNASYQNHDKAMRGHRSVESSPSMRRCVRYKEAALAHDRNDPWDPDDDDQEPSNSGSQRPSPKQHGSYSANQSPINARRGILHDKTGDNSRATPGTYNGRCTVDEADEDREAGDDGATCRRVMNDKDLRRGALGPGAARANIPLEGEPEVPRTRTLVRKASYICGIQQHSVLDDLTDSVD